MRFRIAKASSFEPNTSHGRRKTHYHNPKSIKLDSARYQIPPSPIGYEIPQVWSHHVFPLVLDKFAAGIVDTSINSSMFVTIPRIISSSQEGSPVYAVCDAIAHAYLATVTGSPTEVLRRDRAYGTALRAVNAALTDPTQYKNDSTLLSIWMFVVYEQAKALIAGRESPQEVLTWISKLRLYMKPSESISIQACQFAYHTTRICSEIRKVKDNPKITFTFHKSILSQMLAIQKTWDFSCDLIQPSESFIGVHSYQGNFQMHLSASVLNLHDTTYQEDYSHQHYTHFAPMKEHCIATFRNAATRILHMQGTFRNMNHLELGWGDAVMINGSLRTIATSRLSLPWQVYAASKARAAIKQRLGF
ncbi:hypothetical protein N7478_009397 [Penicillium angulare]|uniref:uncharacterized protein n=1 Tax=Penicillium angulare TaxID=116970 RepID=UPI002541BA15|nr:uncharacterized protein N7478_009397 [Penicillium angulare]KAJ5266589.1 hypothetical protein N7478_009397 [Penicillium angulare]